MKSWQTTGIRPKLFGEEPNIPDSFEPVFLAFQRLNSGRRSGMNGPEPIAISEITSYLDRFEYFGDDDFFVAAIQELDKVFLDHITKESDRKRDHEKALAQNRRKKR